MKNAIVRFVNGLNSATRARNTDIKQSVAGGYVTQIVFEEIRRKYKFVPFSGVSNNGEGRI